MYIYICVCIYIYIHTYIHTCIHTSYIVDASSCAIHTNTYTDIMHIANGNKKTPSV
jgi:hypothetical protein